MSTQNITENVEVEMIEEGEHVFYIEVSDDTLVLPKDGMSEFCRKQIRSVFDK